MLLFAPTAVAVNWQLVASTGIRGDGVNTPAISTVGATLLVCAVGSLYAQQGVNDSLNNTWTAVGWRSTYSSTFYYTLSPIVGATHTFRANGTGAAISVQAWQGATPLLDQGPLFSAAAQTASLTPAKAPALLITDVTDYSTSGAPPYTIDSGYTIPAGNNWPGLSPSYGSAAAYLIQAAAAASRPIWSMPGGPLGTPTTGILSFVGA